MSTWVIVRKSDLAVLNHYDSDVKKDTIANWDSQQCEPLAAHMALPDGMDADCLECDMVDSVMTLSQNSDKIQARRDAKLDQLRALREPKLASIDIMCHQLVLALRSDTSAVAAYRQALLDCTATYKKVDGHAKASVDSADWSSFSWPTAP